MTHSDDNRTVLLLARPGPVRGGLRALLSALPGITTIEAWEDGHGPGASVVERLSALVIIEVTPADATALAFIHHLKDEMPDRPCLVLADSVELQGMALAAGADAAVLTGTPAAELYATLVRILWPTGTSGDI